MQLTDPEIHGYKFPGAKPDLRVSISLYSRAVSGAKPQAGLPFITA